MTKFLLKHGAEVHLPNAKGETAVSLGEQNCIDVRSNFKIEVGLHSRYLCLTVLLEGTPQRNLRCYRREQGRLGERA